MRWPAIGIPLTFLFVTGWFICACLTTYAIIDASALGVLLLIGGLIWAVVREAKA